MADRQKRFIDLRSNPRLSPKARARLDELEFELEEQFRRMQTPEHRAAVELLFGTRPRVRLTQNSMVEW